MAGYFDASDEASEICRRLLVNIKNAQSNYLLLSDMHRAPPPPCRCRCRRDDFTQAVRRQKQPVQRCHAKQLPAHPRQALVDPPRHQVEPREGGEEAEARQSGQAVQDRVAAAAAGAARHGGQGHVRAGQGPRHGEPPGGAALRRHRAGERHGEVLRGEVPGAGDERHGEVLRGEVPGAGDGEPAAEELLELEEAGRGAGGARVPVPRHHP
uniref:Uncharacterized protein n=1 Tax=Oryza brachyantha TaxID=4533 RepID=J3LXV1_ORYBR